MTKRKRNIFIIVLTAIILVLAAATLTIVFAYNFLVEYNYNVTAHSSELTASYNGSTGINISRTAGAELAATKADLVIVTHSSAVTVGSYTPVKIVPFTGIDLNNYYKLVFEDVVLTGDSTFYSSGPIVSVLAAAMSEATYTNDGGQAVTVIYDNIFVASETEFMLSDFETRYNNIYELWGNYTNNKVVSRTVYLLSDITVSSNYEYNIPCSINLLGAKLTLDADLRILHSYAGAYYINASSNGYSGAAGIYGSGMLYINTPKAYYRADTAYANIEYEKFNNKEYADYILDDALAFARSSIPAKTYQSLILPQSFQTFGVDFSYYIIESDSSLTPFSGRVTTLAEEESLYRAASNVTYSLRIVAKTDGALKSTDLAVRVVGAGEQAMLEELLSDITQVYISTGSSLSLDVNLISLISEAYGAGGFGSAMTFTVAETMALPITDENACRLTLNGDSALSFTVSYNPATGKLMHGADEVTSFLLRSGIVTISEQLTLTVTSGSGSVNTDYSLSYPTHQQVLYYLRTSSPIFTTNKTYPLLNVQSGEIYIGSTTLLTTNDLSLTNIEYSLVLITGDSTDPTSITNVNVADYFDLTDGGLSLELRTDIYSIPNNIYLKYECTFADGEKGNIYIRIRKSIANDGGESQEFESSNPFDELFMNSDVMWVEGGTFTVSEGNPHHYAFIEILSINGVTYSSSAADNMCKIEPEAPSWLSPGNYPSGSCPSGTFYKTLHFVTDRDFVPITDSYVKVRCYYYQSEVDQLVLTQDYTVTIPGIFKYDDGRVNPLYTPYVFNDKNFYEITVETMYNYFKPDHNAYVSKLADDSLVLLANSANARVKLDYSSLDYIGGGVDTTGLERLKGAWSIILDGVTVMSMAGFADMADSALEELSLKDCLLTNYAMYGGNTESYIYNIFLETLNLEGNCLTTTEYLVARSVKDLNLARQRSGALSGLTSFDGLASAAELVTLDLSDNAIYSFELLKSFSYLRTVYIYKNRLSADGYDEPNRTNPVIAGGVYPDYGTDGLLNMPYYVELIKNRDTSIYAYANNLTDSGRLEISTTDSYQKLSTGGKIPAALAGGVSALNGFAPPTMLYSLAGRENLYDEVVQMRVQGTSGGSTGGINSGSSIYTFVFMRRDTGAVSTLAASVTSWSHLFLHVNRTYQATVSGTVASPTRCSYIIAVQSGSTIIGLREFQVSICY